jgi:hypothetical protein
VPLSRVFIVETREHAGDKLLGGEQRAKIMDTDRQGELESPLIEDFLDCDQLISDSDGDSSGSASPRRSLKRLHIHVDMTSTQYLTPAAHPCERVRTDGLPVCSSGPPTVAFSSPDLDPYSAVCSPL